MFIPLLVLIALSPLVARLLAMAVSRQREYLYDGIWLNRGQFRRYKHFQQDTRAAKMDKETIVGKLPHVFADPKSWMLTGTKGIYAYPHGQEENDDDIGIDTIGSAVKLILQTRVRMILGF